MRKGRVRVKEAQIMEAYQFSTYILGVGGLHIAIFI